MPEAALTSADRSGLSANPNSASGILGESAVGIHLPAEVIAQLRRAPFDGKHGPRRQLLLLRDMVANPIEAGDWAFLHQRMASVVAVRGLQAVQFEYADLVTLFEAHWSAFRSDIALQTIAKVVTTLDTPEHLAHVVHPFDPSRHDVIVFCAGEGMRERFAWSGGNLDDVYGVNVSPADAPGVDLVGDMSRASELQSLPSHQCRELYAEYVPAFAYFNAEFFPDRAAASALGRLVGLEAQPTDDGCFLKHPGLVRLFSAAWVCDDRRGESG